MNPPKLLLLTPVIIATMTACSTKQKPDLENLDFGFKPNILWISCEDISPYLPMYGDSTVQTPNLERLADEGIVFESAFAPTGQCAPTRHSIITGMHSTATSGSNMRTGGKQFPDSIHCFPLYLIDAGYYCTNNSKTDYNFSIPAYTSLWSESSRQAHWNKRPRGSRFFSVFNLGVTHESQLLRKTPLVVSPDNVQVPPYYPDIEIVRNDIARVYNNIIELDSLVGQHLDDLEEAGLLDSTIIIFWSDHGGPLPRQKREVLESGIRIPLIVRLPAKKFAGTRNEDLISLVDLGPTVLSLAGIPVPPNMHGKAFMGEYRSNPEKYVFGGFDRKAGTIDMVRYARSKNYLYIHNYYPDLPHWARTGYRIDKIPMMKEILKLRDEGKLNPDQMRWFANEKSLEELYDIEIDPHCLNNLAEDPTYSTILEEHRKAHFNWFMDTKDIGLFPEPLQFTMEKKYGMTMYEIMRKYDLPLDEIRNNALLWTKGKESLEQLIQNLDDSLAVIRYHAAIGIGNLGVEDESARELLLEHLEDEYPTVRAACAYALIELGYLEKAVPEIFQQLEEGPENYERGCVVLSLLKRMEKGPELFGEKLKAIQQEIAGTAYEGQYFSQELDNVIILFSTNSHK